MNDDIAKTIVDGVRAILFLTFVIAVVAAGWAVVGLFVGLAIRAAKFVIG